MASFTKRGDSWRAVVKHKGSKTQTCTFARKSDAVVWARGVEDRMKLGHHHGDAKMTVEALYKKYIEAASTKSGTRWERIRLNSLVRTAAFVVKTIERLTSQDIKKWKDKRLTEVSAATVNREMNLQSGVFSHAVKEWDMKLVNPFLGVSRPADPPPRNRRVLTAEVNAVRVPCKPHTVMWYLPTMFEFAIETAMRLGEICALRWDQVNLDEDWVFVAKSKNGDSRFVPLTGRAKEILEKLPRGEMVFPLNAQVASVMFTRMVKKAGIADLHFHDSRHEATSRLSKKLHVLELAKVIGHRDLKSLLTYYNPTPKELADKLNAA